MPLTILTWFLVALFVVAGLMKVLTPYAAFKKKMAWAESLTPNQLKLVGTAEILGAAGLVLPTLFDVAVWLMPLAAIGLTITAWSATLLHLGRKEQGSVIFSFVIGLLAAYVAYNNISFLGL